MPRDIVRAGVLALLGGVAVTCGAASQAMAQDCVTRAGQGSGPSREAAMRMAYENVLRAVDPSLAQRWSNQNLRIGDAPGFSVGKLTSKCDLGGAGQVCRIEASLCRN